MGYLRKSFDMVFHTGGMTMLIDGATDPHVIRGHNVEDDFGFTWASTTRLGGWVVHGMRTEVGPIGMGLLCFFGPDPIAF